MKNVFQKIKDTVQVALIYSALTIPTLVSANNGGTNTGSPNQYINDVFQSLDVQTSTEADTKSNLLTKIKEWIPFIMGIAAAILVIIAIIRGVTIALSGDSPQKRSEALKGVLFLILGAAVVGGAALLVSLAFGLLR